MKPSKLIQHQLSNGLRVVIAPDSHLPLAATALYYDVGARNEAPGRTGFAHLFEHLMFEGSAHVEKGSHFKLISDLGGQINANTTHERTAYFASLPANQLDVVLWMEADRMRSLIVDEASFEHQRSTVLEERKQRVDNVPFGAARELFSTLCHPGFAYSHPVIGFEEDILSAELEQVQAFHQSWYRPNNAVMAVAGDVDPDQVLKRIEDWFGDISSGTLGTLPEFIEPPRTVPEKAIVEEKMARLSKVMVSHQVPSYGHPDFYAFEMAETLLLRGPSSRAWRNIIMENRVALSLGGGYAARRAASRFSMTATVERPEQMDGVVNAWQAELDRFAHSPISPEEWGKGLNQIRASHVYAQEGVLSRALSVGRYALNLNEPDWLDSYVEHLEELDPVAVQEVVGEMLQEKSRVELHVVAKGGEA
jgi:zinc protease